MWKFKYLRADRKGVEIGPFTSKKEAEEARDKMVSFGAICMVPFEASGEVPKKEGGYVDQKVPWFESYFVKEIAILRERGVTYQISYEFLKTLIQRAKLFVGENAPFVPVGDNAKGVPKEKLEEWKQQREEYLSQVAGIIEEEASRYSPADGSFWESVSEYLKWLAEAVKAGEVKKKK